MSFNGPCHHFNVCIIRSYTQLLFDRQTALPLIIVEDFINGYLQQLSHQSLHHETYNASLGIFGVFGFMLADHLNRDKQQLLAYDFF